MQKQLDNGIELEKIRRDVKKALPGLLFVFIIGNLMIQAFNLVYSNIGSDLHVSETAAALLSTLPGIILGIVCMLYETLCDYISPKKMVLWGVGILTASSIAGFFLSFNFWVVLAVRALQVAGAQVSGSVFLVMTIKFLNKKEKAVYLGIFNAAYYLSVALGVFAGGFIEEIPWKWLLLIPALSIAVFPILAKDTPNVSGEGERVDVIGISIFAGIATCLAVYFSYMQFWWLWIVFAVLVAAFSVNVAKNKDSFMTPAFLKNGRYMIFLALLAVSFFFEYACTPIYQVIGGGIYKISLQQVSWWLTGVNLVAMVVGIFSGPLINKIGHYAVIVLSLAAELLGFGLSAVFIHSSFWFLSILNAVTIAGFTAIYTPIYDGATGALPQGQRGRAVGMCDLIVNVIPAIGIAVYSDLIESSALGRGSLFGVKGMTSSQAANVFWIMFLVALAALALTLAFRKQIASVSGKAVSVDGEETVLQ